MKIAVGYISTLGRIRGADPDQVKALADSIKEVGLLSPITVTRGQIVFNGQRVDGFQLVAGLHRLEACKSLGMTEIGAVVVDLDEQQRIIAECDENLCGTKLTPTERAEFTARRKEAYEALHPEAAHGRATANKDANLASFAEAQAEKTGASKRAIQRDAERGLQVCKEALEILKGTKADTGAVLDRLKGLPAAQQVVEAAREVNARAAPRTGQGTTEARRKSFIDADVKERAAKEAAEIIAEHVPGDFWDGLKANLYAAGAKSIADALTNITGQSVMDKGGWK